MITAVTTCMGRLEHLQTTLPLMLSEFDEVIVVDWSCPQNSGQWAASEGARVVFKKNKRHFHLCAARNAGAREVKSRSVCFLDADTVVMPGLKKDIESLLNLSTMVVAARDSQGKDCTNLNGFIAVDIGQFWGVKGYDESLEGYALEDAHLRARLCLERGLKPKRVSKLAHIRHTNELRGRFYKEPIHVSSKRGYDALQDYLRTHNVRDWKTDPRTSEIAYHT